MMKTCTFKSVLWGATRRLGMDPAKNLLADQAETLTEYINARLKEAWEHQDWPALCRIEERVPDASDVISFTQAGQPVIAQVLGIYAVNPDRVREPLEIDWELRGHGIQLFRTVVRCWVYYRPEAPIFTSVAWLPNLSYVVGDLVYRASTGDCFKALLPNSNTDVMTTGTWARVLFPDFLASYVKQAVWSDALREDGQPDKATVEESRAEDLLIKEADKVGLQIGRQARYGARV